ncbi:hypothetical protein ABH966_002311 [Lysinibacillus sp. RC46]|uniref:hypothetical protein n=1 Tax=unclassified Lysinibacillus TaxID=2636778 RepID=UPI0035156F17
MAEFRVLVAFFAWLAAHFDVLAANSILSLSFGKSLSVSGGILGFGGVLPLVSGATHSFSGELYFKSVIWQEFYPLAAESWVLVAFFAWLAAQFYVLAAFFL